MSLGIMQRRHFALTQINEAVDLMQDLSHNGMRLALFSIATSSWQQGKSHDVNLHIASRIIQHGAMLSCF